MSDIEKDTKQEGPLPVRADENYKNSFRELSKDFKSQKEFFEFLIDSYIEKVNSDNDENLLSFSNEINLISNDLNNILTIFKNIATKSHDSIRSLEENYKQQIINLNTDLYTQTLKSSSEVNELKDTILILTEKIDLLEKCNNGFELEKEKLLNTIQSLESDINKLEISNSELTKEAYNLKNIERENLNLEKKNSSLTQQLKEKETELSTMRNLLSSKDSELSKAHSQLQELENFSSTCKLNFEKELTLLKEGTELFKSSVKEANLKELELQYKSLEKEIEIKYKNELLDWKNKFSELQIEYNKLQIENLNLLNKKNGSAKDKKTEPVKNK